MSKYKYYFRKPKSEIVKDILTWLVIAGVVSIAATSPYFVVNLLKGFQKGKKYEKKKIHDTFYILKKQGLLSVEEKGRQIYISLTEEGRKKAGWLQINDLKIQKPKRWDKKWRLVIFDIAQMKLLQRNAFRGKLKELGFYCLQRSVWLHPYPCKDEVGLLRGFFGLTQQEIRLITAESIEDDELLRKNFKLQ